MSQVFTNVFTGQTFEGTLRELYERLGENKNTILNKTDIVKSHGWSWDEDYYVLK